MKTVVLCGGLGTRLREEMELHSKPLVNVGPRPMLWRILKANAHPDCRQAGFFFALDTCREYQHLHELWAAGSAPGKGW